MQIQQKQPKIRRHVPLLAAAIILVTVLAGVLLGLTAARRRAAAIAAEKESAALQEAAADDPAAEEDAPFRGYDDLALNTYNENGFFREGAFRRYVDEKSTAGVDISDHSGSVDWSAVKAAGADFALLRAGYRGYTEGTIQEDTQFSQNFSEAREAGLELGVYFFSQAICEEEAVEEAQFVLSLLDGAPLEYPIFFDWEYVEQSARTGDMDPNTLTACAKAFCETVDNAGYRGGIYFNQSQGYEQYDLSALKDYTFWLAEYADVPTFTYDFAIWQYTNDGTVDGISEAADMNVAFRKQ